MRGNVATGGAEWDLPQIAAVDQHVAAACGVGRYGPECSRLLIPVGVRVNPEGRATADRDLFAIEQTADRCSVVVDRSGCDRLVSQSIVFLI